MRALLLEDSLQLQAILGIALRDMDFTVDCVRSISDAVDALKFEQFDIVIIDLDMESGDILSTLRTLQIYCKGIWMLVLAGTSGVDMVSAAMDYGAHDFILKPIKPRELRLRLSTRVKTDSTSKDLRALECGPLKLDQMTRVVTLDGRELELTPRERTVLEVLLRNKGTTVSKAFIASRIYSFDDEAGPAAIQIYVHRIRKKTAHPNLKIHTVRGAGYRIATRNLESTS